MYVIEGSPAEDIGGIITTEVALFPADRCVWRTVENIETIATDTGYTATSASPTSVTISQFGNFRSQFPIGTMVSPNADGSAAVAVTSTSYSGTSDRTALSIVGGTFAISSSIYIVTTRADGYAVAEAEFCPPGGTDYTAISNPTLGYVGKTGRFVAITN